MDIELLLVKVRELEQPIIAHWLQTLTDRFPNIADYDELYRRGQAYFQYMTELHIAADQHPILLEAVDGDANSDIHEDKFKWIIISSQCWRQALLEVGAEALTIPLFKQISERIDKFESAVCRSSWMKTTVWLKKKDIEFDTLHDDRMNLIGKMAASMAHEIRNPLTSVKGFLKLLRGGIHQGALEKADTYLDYIEHECDNIMMQVTGFLSFSKRPIMEEELACMPAKQMLDNSLSMLNPRLIDENVDLTLDAPESIKLCVQKLAIQQVLSNLLNNGIDALSALKSNKKMHISCYEDSDYTYIRVSNNGPRIPAEMAHNIFTPFVTNKENGTGLGLAICKQIMMKNNGDISFTSDDNETSFFLSFSKKGSSSSELPKSS